VSSDRFVTVQFCDDIRRELGNKVSLMGCYLGDLLVPSFPSVLPQLCAQVKVYTPLNRPFERLTLRMLRGGDIIAELVVPPELFALPKGALPPAARWSMATGNFVMAPFPLEGSSILCVEAETEDGTLRSGALRIDMLSADMHQRELSQT